MSREDTPPATDVFALTARDSFTLADAALGYASNSQGVVSASIDSHIVYSRPAGTGEVLTATAVEISRSSKLSNYCIDVVRGNGKLVAAMTGTTYISGKPVEV